MVTVYFLKFLGAGVFPTSFKGQTYNNTRGAADGKKNKTILKLMSYIILV